MLLLVEVLCVLAIAAGVGLIYVPAGIIVAGVLGLLACEVAATRRAAVLRSRAAPGPERAA